jgi:hypothetical protein
VVDVVGAGEADDARRGGALVCRGPGNPAGQGYRFPTQGEAPEGGVITLNLTSPIFLGRRGWMQLGRGSEISLA